MVLLSCWGEHLSPTYTGSTSFSCTTGTSPLHARQPFHLCVGETSPPHFRTMSSSNPSPCQMDGPTHPLCCLRAFCPQYDMDAFQPNAPPSMRHPPPEEKGKTFLQHFLDTLPEVNTTANILVVLIPLSSHLEDIVSLPHHLGTPQPRRWSPLPC